MNNSKLLFWGLVTLLSIGFISCTKSKHPQDNAQPFQINIDYYGLCYTSQEGISSDYEGHYHIKDTFEAIVNVRIENDSIYFTSNSDWIDPLVSSVSARINSKIIIKENITFRDYTFSLDSLSYHWFFTSPGSRSFDNSVRFTGKPEK